LVCSLIPTWHVDIGFISKHGGNPPLTPPEKTELKNIIAKMKKKDDEENFDEATAQAYRVWTVTTVR
jgi:amyloid beta precursor protein binding protein 1